MDERTVEAAQSYQDRLNEHAATRGCTTRDYTVVVLGHDDDKPFIITAKGRQDCIDQLAARKIKVSSDPWGAAHTLGDDVMTFGRSDEAQQLAEQEVRLRS